MAVAGELASYKLDLVGVQEVRWNTGGKLIPGVIIVSREKLKKIIN